MKILHISSAGKFSGAGLAALSLHQEQLRNGINSKILFLKEDVNAEKSVFSYVHSLSTRLFQIIVTFLDRSLILRYKSNKSYLFSASIFGLGIHNHKLIKEADIIHLHWINHAFLSIKDISKINKPIVWTMHDMWAFTGGCHYAYDCDAFTASCGLCPVLNSKNINDLSYHVLQNKLKFLGYKSIYFVAISTWMKDLANNSSFLKDKVKNIVFSGIDSSIFYFANKKIKYRKELKLPLERRIVLIGAGDIHNPAKGVRYSIEALKSLDVNVVVINFGNGLIDSHILGKEVINIGFVKEKDLMAKYYQSADVFLSTSVAEAFGMTVAEAQCCGTPVIAFSKGGPKDIVEHGKSGYLTGFGNTKQITNFLYEALNFEFNHNEISENAIKKFSLKKTSENYEGLYLKALEGC